MNDKLQVSLKDIADMPALGRSWRDLEQRAEASFFQSWSWIGCLLSLAMPAVRPQVLVVRAADTTVGLAILTGATRMRRRWLRSKGLYLNETGHPRYDGMTIEYNGVLADRTMANRVEAAALRWLVARYDGWNELFVSGLIADRAEGLKKTAGQLGLGVWQRDVKRCDYVDLGPLDGSVEAHDATLSRNTRYQIRRARRLYGGDGALDLATASSPDEALEWLAGLKGLHQHYWQGRGRPGAFANPFFERFHSRLIEQRFDHGEIQLCRITTGGEAIGYLYNFVHRGWVYAYQSGFRYDADPKLKPGLLSHYMAIGHNLTQGARVYDFMAGEGQHKRSLSNACHEMEWLALQRGTVALRIESMMRHVKARLARPPA